MNVLDLRQHRQSGRRVDDRDAAVAALTDIVRAEPESADEVFLVAQDDEGHVGETIYGSSLRVTA